MATLFDLPKLREYLMQDHRAYLRLLIDRLQSTSTSLAVLRSLRTTCGEIGSTLTLTTWNSVGKGERYFVLYS